MPLSEYEKLMLEVGKIAGQHGFYVKEHQQGLGKTRVCIITINEENQATPDECALILDIQEHWEPDIIAITEMSREVPFLFSIHTQDTEGATTTTISKQAYGLGLRPQGQNLTFANGLLQHYNDLLNIAFAHSKIENGAHYLLVDKLAKQMGDLLEKINQTQKFLVRYHNDLPIFTPDFFSAEQGKIILSSQDQEHLLQHSERLLAWYNMTFPGPFNRQSALNLINFMQEEKAKNALVFSLSETVFPHDQEISLQRTLSEEGMGYFILTRRPEKFTTKTKQ